MRVIVPLIFALSLASCQTMAGGETKNALCIAFKPIRWSKGDTLETQHQTTAHNAVGARVCGWRQK